MVKACSLIRAPFVAQFWIEWNSAVKGYICSHREGCCVRPGWPRPTEKEALASCVEGLPERERERAVKLSCVLYASREHPPIWGGNYRGGRPAGFVYQW
jgi:hypothetical protein